MLAFMKRKKVISWNGVEVGNSLFGLFDLDSILFLQNHCIAMVFSILSTNPNLDIEKWNNENSKLKQVIEQDLDKLFGQTGQIWYVERGILSASQSALT